MPRGLWNQEASATTTKYSRSWPVGAFMTKGFPRGYADFQPPCRSTKLVLKLFVERMGSISESIRRKSQSKGKSGSDCDDSREKIGRSYGARGCGCSAFDLDVCQQCVIPPATVIFTRRKMFDGRQSTISNAEKEDIVDTLHSLDAWIKRMLVETSRHSGDDRCCCQLHVFLSHVSI